MYRLYLFIICCFATFYSFSQSEYANQMENDIILGSQDAPITIIDYSSFSCPSCAYFHNEVLPSLEEAYINHGKVKLIFRSYPLRAIDLKASTIPLCAPKNTFYSFVKVLFKTQNNWAFESSHPIETLEHLAKLGGLSGEEVQHCFNDITLEDKIINVRKMAQQELNINATPTLIINGKMYEGGLKKKKLFNILEKLLTESTER